MSSDTQVDDEVGGSIHDVRQYWNDRPCNIRHSMKPLGSQEYFDEVEQRKYFVEPHIVEFADFPAWRDKRVLEVGCGIGTDAVNFARAGAIYTGVDLSDASVRLAQQRFAVYGLTGEIMTCNGEELSAQIPTRGFDLVYSFGVIHHSPDQRKLVEEIRQLVAPDGQFRFMVYARNSWKDVMIEAGYDQPEAQAGCPIATTYTPDMIAELLAGIFEPVDVRQAHIFPYLVEPYRRYEYQRQPWFEAMPTDMFEALERRFGWHTLVTARPI